MDGTKITLQSEGHTGSYMVGTKITRPVDGWHKNNLPKGWVEEKFIGRHRDNLLDQRAVAGAS